MAGSNIGCDKTCLTYETAENGLEFYVRPSTSAYSTNTYVSINKTSNNSNKLSSENKIPYGKRKVKSYDLLSRDCHMTTSYAVAGKRSRTRTNYKMYSMLLCFLFASFVLCTVDADTPANCSYEDIRGTWIFHVGSLKYDKTVQCTSVGWY